MVEPLVPPSADDDARVRGYERRGVRHDLKITETFFNSDLEPDRADVDVTILEKIDSISFILDSIKRLGRTFYYTDYEDILRNVIFCRLPAEPVQPLPRSRHHRRGARDARRDPVAPGAPVSGGRTVRRAPPLLAGYETVDLLSRNYLGRESLLPGNSSTRTMDGVPTRSPPATHRRPVTRRCDARAGAPDDRDHPVASVKVEDQELVDYVVRVQLEESDSRADVVRVTFADGNLVMCDVLHEGQKVEIDMGRSDEHALVFRGVATSVTATFPRVGSPFVELVAQDSLILLALRPQTKRWGGTNVSSIVRRIALANSLVAGSISPGDDTAFPEERPAQQVAETDLAFLQRLARAYDSKLFVDHSGPVDSLNMVSTQSLLDADPLQQTLIFNSTLVDFRVGFDAWAADPEEHLVTTDPDSGDRVTVDETLFRPDDITWTPDPTRIAQMGDGAARVTALVGASAGARAQMRNYQRVPPRLAGAAARPASEHGRVHGDRLRHRGHTGRGRASGSIWIRPRARVQVLGYGGRWSGTWYLSRVRHELDLVLRTYACSFVCTR